MKPVAARNLDRLHYRLFPIAVRQVCRLAGWPSAIISIPYWGADGPTGAARVPIVIVSHSVPQGIPPDSVYIFVDSVEAAFETAKKMAGDGDISISGADVARQSLKLGLIDELSIHLVPVLFGSGTRLFEHLDSDHISLEILEVIDTAEVIHMRFRVVK